MKKLLTAIILSLLIPSVVGAATYYVGKTGSDSNTCTQAQSQSTPKLTITAGVHCLSAGDNLQIKAGTYVDTFRGSDFISLSGTSYNNATTIQAFGSDVVTINGGIGFGSPGTGKAIRYIVFKNLIFDGTGLVGLIGFGGGSNGGSVDHIKLDGIEGKKLQPITNASAMVHLGGTDGVGTDIWITNSKFHGTGCTTISGVSNFMVHLIYVESGNNLIEHSELYDATGFGIHQYAGSAGNNTYRYNWIHGTGVQPSPCLQQTAHGILITTASGNQAYGNLVTNNLNGIQVGSSNNIVYNNTVYGNGVGFSNPSCCYPGIGIMSGSGNTVKNNIVFGNVIDSVDTSGSTGTVVSNNLTIYPSFVDTAGNNFTLKAVSPAIDAGTSSIAAGVTILSYSGSAPDIGAYEYGSLVSSVGVSSIGTSTAIALPAPPSNLAVVSP